MTIAVRAVTTPSSDSSSPYTVSKPTGTAEGDLLLASVVVTSDAIDQVRPPDGWFACVGGGINGEDNISTWYKVAGASEPSSYNFTSGTNAIVGVGLISLYSDIASPLQIADIASQINASGDRVCPDVTFPSAGMFVGFVACKSSLGATAPGGATEQWDTTLSGNRTGCYTAAVASSGDYGLTATGSSAISKCISLAVIEAATTYPGIRYRTNANTGPTNSAGSIGVTMPATIVAGDMLLAHLTLDSDTTVTTPTDWTLQANLATTGALRIFSKVADGSEASATLTVSFTGTITASLAVSVWYSPDGDDLTIGQVETDSTGAAASITFPSVTSTQSGSAFVMLTSKAQTTQYQLTNEIDMWKRYDFGGSSIRTTMFSEYLLAIGATGTRVAEPTSGTHAADMVSLLIEIDPPDVISRIYPSERYTGVVFNGLDVTAYLRAGNLEGTTEQLPAQSLADDWPTTVPGATDWRISLEGLLTKAIDDIFGIEALSRTPTFRDMAITVGETDNSTTYTWEADGTVGAFVADYKIGPNVQFGAIPFRAEIGVSGAPVRTTT